MSHAISFLSVAALLVVLPAGCAKQSAKENLPLTARAAEPAGREEAQEARNVKPEKPAQHWTAATERPALRNADLPSPRVARAHEPEPQALVGPPAPPTRARAAEPPQDLPYPECAQVLRHLRESLNDPGDLRVLSWNKSEEPTQGRWERTNEKPPRGLQGLGDRYEYVGRDGVKRRVTDGRQVSRWVPADPKRGPFVLTVRFRVGEGDGASAERERRYTITDGQITRVTGP